ncbi:hypothetical protein QQP08_018526 [Theobroma cacao]|nr:hypothetical protein QQP08_018526 [Theobroma cacao]
MAQVSQLPYHSRKNRRLCTNDLQNGLRIMVAARTTKNKGKNIQYFDDSEEPGNFYVEETTTKVKIQVKATRFSIILELSIARLGTLTYITDNFLADILDH